MDKAKGYGLDFISSEDLYNHVFETVSAYRFNLNLKEFNTNLIDPIKLTFDSIVYSQSIQNTIENEVLRQLDKTNSNLIGYFHQNIFKYFGNEWTVPDKGYDIVNLNKKIFCELKNKHNTMNSSSGAKTYMKMQNSLIQDPNAKCMLVEVIAKRSQNIPWIVSLDGERQPLNENLRRVSIDKFYDIVTEHENSFVKLCSILPKVIGDVVRFMSKREKRIEVYDELNDISDDLLTSIYLLSFKHYEGFNNFNIKDINEE